MLHSTQFKYQVLSEIFSNITQAERIVPMCVLPEFYSYATVGLITYKKLLLLAL